MREDAWGPLDAALSAFRSGEADAALSMRTDVGGEEEVPLRLFFRKPGDMGAVERTALDRARGRVLDLGAGVGAAAVPLLGRGLPVTAAEILPEARRFLAEAGVEDVRAGGVETVGESERFDTVLVLVNGLGLAGTLAGLVPFLAAIASVLAEGGQILADSTDPDEWESDDDGRRPGEVHMQVGFKGAWGPPFPFVFVAPGDLTAAAARVGLAVELLEREEAGRFLARLTRAPGTGR